MILIIYNRQVLILFHTFLNTFLLVQVDSLSKIYHFLYEALFICIPIKMRKWVKERRICFHGHKPIYWYIVLDKSGGVEVLAVMREKESFFLTLHVFVADGVWTGEGELPFKCLKTSNSTWKFINMFTFMSKHWERIE